MSFQHLKPVLTSGAVAMGIVIGVALFVAFVNYPLDLKERGLPAVDKTEAQVRVHGDRTVKIVDREGM